MTADILELDSYSFKGFRARVVERFESRADVLAAIGGDHALNPDYADQLAKRTFRDAAVLIPVVERAGDAHMILTQRTDHLSSHSGQIAFPGGKIDDGESAVDAALREAHEEIGLEPARIEVLGEFGTYYSGSGFSVAPVVGMVSGTPELSANPEEVADIFEVPVAFLMNRDSHAIESKFWNEKERHFYRMPWKDESVDPPIERNIWGLTAGIIRMVQERLYGG